VLSDVFAVSVAMSVPPLPWRSDIVTLALPTFTATAELAGWSRVLGGYHIQSDNLAGLTLGRQVADVVWARSAALFDGKNP
jgi:hypothetical protein